MAILEATIPETWNELSRRNIRYIASKWEEWRLNVEKYKAVIEDEDPEKIEEFNFTTLKERTALFLNLTKIDQWYKWRSQYLFWKLNDNQLFEILKDVNFVFSDIQLTKNPYPTLRIGVKKWYAPLNGFSNLTAAEFAFADSAFLGFWKTGSLVYLNKLICILYRPKASNNTPTGVGYTGDIREPFNRYNIEARSSRLRFTSHNTKIAILLWYMGSRKSYQDQFKNIFSGENKGKASKYGWITVFRELAGKDLTKIPLVENQNLTLFLSSLDMQITEAKDLQSKMKK